MKTKKQKFLWVVRGSEDGNLGIYGNKKLAHKEAVKYLMNAGDDTKIKGTYREFCKLIKSGGISFTVEGLENNGEYNCSAEIQGFIKNETF